MLNYTYTLQKVKKNLRKKKETAVDAWNSSSGAISLIPDQWKKIAGIFCVSILTAGSCFTLNIIKLL